MDADAPANNLTFAAFVHDATSPERMVSPVPHLRRDWARRCHTCTRIQHMRAPCGYFSPRVLCPMMPMRAGSVLCAVNNATCRATELQGTSTQHACCDASLRAHDRLHTAAGIRCKRMMHLLCAAFGT